MVQQATSTLDEVTASGNETAITAAKAALATAQSNLASAKTVTAADEPPLIGADQTALMDILLAAPADVMHVGAVEAASLVASGSQPSATLAAALTVAPFHRQPPLVAVPSLRNCRSIPASPLLRACRARSTRFCCSAASAPIGV